APALTITDVVPSGRAPQLEPVQTAASAIKAATTAVRIVRGRESRLCLRLASGLPVISCSFQAERKSGDALRIRFQTHLSTEIPARRPPLEVCPRGSLLRGGALSAGEWL